MGEARIREKQGMVTRTVNVRAHYLHIIEWLPLDDRHTGTELYLRLQEHERFKIVLDKCASKAEVFKALERVAANCRAGNHPIVHFEAHGDGRNSDWSEGLMGPAQPGGEELLSWKELAPSLRQLNLLTRFNLQVVAAACYGGSAINAVESPMAMPYTAILGFIATVGDRDLFNSMRELYRAMFNGGTGDSAIESAQRELPTGCRLHSETAHTLAHKLMSMYAREHLNPSSLRERAERHVEHGRKMGVPMSLRHAENFVRKVSVEGLRKAVPIWFAFDQIPENRDRFRFDFKTILAHATPSV
jgi:hypothetical protein